jgi:hypothetical protein
MRAPAELSWTPDPSTSSVFLYDAPCGAAPEKVRPYTRKFE